MSIWVVVLFCIVGVYFQSTSASACSWSSTSVWMKVLIVFSWHVCAFSDGWINVQMYRAVWLASCFTGGQYLICVSAPTLPPDSFTLQIETAAAYETSGYTPVRGPTPKLNKRNVLAPLGLCVLRTFICGCGLFVEDSHLKCVGCVTEMTECTPVAAKYVECVGLMVKLNWHINP